MDSFAGGKEKKASVAVDMQTSVVYARLVNQQQTRGHKIRRTSEPKNMSNKIHDWYNILVHYYHNPAECEEMK